MKKEELNILWTSDNPDTAIHMVMMYADNTLKKGMWDKVTVIIWGAASKLIVTNDEVAKALLESKANGVNYIGCISCAKNLGSEKKLTEMGIELAPMGKPLTDILKNKEYLLTV